MNKKKLPRVIAPTGGATAASSADPQAHPTKLDLVSAPAQVLRDQVLRDQVLRDAGAAASVAEVVVPMPEPASTGLQAASVQRTSPAGRISAARRRARALKIVNRHAGYSAVGGIVPLALVNFASVTGVIVRMVKVLSDHYNVPFERDRARAIVVGLVAGAMPTGLATVTSSTLVHVVPGGTFVGLAVSSLSAAACTRSIGRVFVEHFENGATLIDFPATQRLQTR
jgi:uncharacterized protein (DUF697 family)